MWIVLTLLTSAFAVDETCITALGELETARVAANESRLATVETARSAPALSDLAHQVSQRSAKWAEYLDGQRREGTSEEPDYSADEEVASLATAITTRQALEAELRANEASWISASRARNAALCTHDACADEPPCQGGPHKGSAKLVSSLEDLHSQLAADEASFEERFGFAPMLARALNATDSTPKAGAEENRAGYLYRVLSSGTARPAIARARVGTFLAAVAGLPRLDSQQLAYGRYLLVWSTQRKRTMNLIDGDIDRIIHAWHQLDKADGRLESDARGHMVQVAQDKLTSHDAGSPTSAREFAR